MPSLLSVRVDEKWFGASKVLDQVEFELVDKQVVALLGPSGCGKSTLLRIAAGLDTEFKGQVRKGAAIDPARQAPISYVFQEPRLMPWLSVADNISFLDSGRTPDRAWVQALIDAVGLTGFERALPKQLSGGMAQRAAIARGLYSRPQVLLLDEPFSAVDAFTRMNLQQLVLDLIQRFGISILLVTHDIDEALYLGDDVIVLGARPGRVCARLAVELAHPRARGDAALGVLKERALAELHDAHAF
ncbi:sulfonate ABC transporter ATP-binding protein [Bordetella genomosp. 1]|uniref:Sulfonate ABC transporter ATP-binding protein n=1 Tax=Bordetella genomosp. 1 TaxID=1395607 RepID=A0A261RVC8_9BORD|nr:ABC transporter ATP-binding protein [Bordetella genomosp. 1]OZI28851.1 sulfonate ABC transporter ATP-binding protein [Bordetella genomosp. 1]